jgi:NCS2 family nucleobase:cation symporter-2
VVFISIVIFDLLGPPLIKNCSVFLGLLMGIIVAAGCGYFDNSTISAAPAATFLWTTTFKLSVKGDLILPFIAAYFVIVSFLRLLLQLRINRLTYDVQT